MEYPITLIIGKIEFLQDYCIIHNILEVFKGGSKEETDALIDIPEKEGNDWLVLEHYKGEVKLTIECIKQIVS